MNLLQGIMSYPSFNMKNSLLPQILKLEEHCASTLEESCPRI